MFTGAYFIIIFGVVGSNLMAIYTAYNHRSTEMAEINAYIGRAELNGATVIGEWGPSITWKSNAYLIPTQKERIGNGHLKYHTPTLVVIEYRDKEINTVYSTMLVDLSLYADSVRRFKVNNKYNMELYWMSEESINR